MRRRLMLIVGAIVVAAIAVILVVVRGGDDDGTTTANATGLETRKMSAGAIEITIEPRQIDAQGAVFTITLDTHSTDLSMDLTTATLQVGGTTWSSAAWNGDAPSGHHRTGQLSFTPAGAATGEVRLTLNGFSEPVETTWTIGT